MNLKYIKKPIIGNPIVVLSAIITIGIAIRILFVPFDIPLIWDNFTYFIYAIVHSLGQNTTMQIFHQKIFCRENKSELQLMKKLPLSKSSAVPYSPKNYQNYTMKRKNLQKVAIRYC